MFNSHSKADLQNALAQAAAFIADRVREIRPACRHFSGKGQRTLVCRPGHTGAADQTALQLDPSDKELRSALATP